MTDLKNHPKRDLGKRWTGYSLIELMVVVVIITLFAAIGLRLTTSVLRSNQIINQSRLFKSTFAIAKARAIEHSAPVRVTVGNDRSILVVWDTSRTGLFPAGQESLILGFDVTTGNPSPYRNVVLSPEINDLPHYTGIAGLTVEEFPNNEFIILPDGRILSGTPLQTTSGTFFLASDSFAIDGRPEYQAAVHITAKGEVKMAFRDGHSGGEWNWIE
ncbi:hypothetical protein SCOR_26340 [Sulfidibacter corallicola]|uniref:pilus assembly FimT family protein n=1 Tax=Sulfidibacter corallicola TaxID=2818388 RepID=UPI002351F123|nr:prepilin-type N-terminal cleavage/methylation domain-containing protein [Sulfidibacter corallicola]